MAGQQLPHSILYQLFKNFAFILGSWSATKFLQSSSTIIPIRK